MKRSISRAQAGYALIMMVLALMGVGGVVFTGFTQGVKVESEHERYLHNQRVLREAKQALLQYAYNYPQLGPGQDDGPGRLPCPDIDNDGEEEYVANCGGNIVGRFPWKESELNFYKALDASGEQLWYAVSPNFGRGPGSINSSSFGGITVEDRSGAMLYDGAATIPAGGVAAVIIAPGSPIDRNGTMQVRGTDDEKKEKVNYLDLFGAVDNAEFTNGDSDNGFVTGPIEDVVTGELLVNDQMIVITAAEVIAMAEKATLQAYRTAILDYLDNTGGVYPWLYNYEGIEYDYDPDPGLSESVDVAIDKLSTFFPAGSCSDPSWHTEDDCVGDGKTWDASFTDERDTYLGIDTSGNDDGIFGRIPAIFGEYFAENDSQAIDTALSGSVGITIPQTISCSSCDDAFTLNDDQFQFNDFATVKIPSFSGNQVFKDVQFVDITGADKGQLKGTATAAVSETLKLYFYDNDGGGGFDDPTFVYTPCGDADGNGIAEVRDCHRKASGSLYSGIEVDDPVEGINPNKYKSIILLMEFELDFPSYDPGTDIFSIDLDYSGLVTTVTPAATDSHAIISASFNTTQITPGTMPTISGGTWQIDEHYHVDDTVLFQDSGPHGVGSLDSSGFVVEGPLTLGIRYYPEIPGWAFDNDWHNSIRMAYALEYKPPGTGPCIVDSTCLMLNDSAGKPQETISLLLIGGQHDWTDSDVDGELVDEMADNMGSVFDNGNTDDNETFYRHRGNDKLLVIDRL